MYRAIKKLKDEKRIKTEIQLKKTKNWNENKERQFGIKAI